MAAHSDETDEQAFARIRLVLAASALLAAAADHAAGGQASAAALLVLSVYAAGCVGASVGGRCGCRWARGRLMHRVDAGACAALAATGGQADVVPLVFLFFAIVVASLRYGLDEGARVTIAAVVLYSAALATLPGAAPAGLFLRAALLLAFGRALAQLGEGRLQAARRQALLNDLNQLHNPRFGIDRSMAEAMERTRAFFKADRCMILLEEYDTGRCALRAVRVQGAPAAPVQTVDAGLAHAMLPEPCADVLLHVRRWRRQLRHDAGQMERLADLLEARSFISARVRFARGKGRIYVTARTPHLGRADAMFLARIAARELLAIDRLDVLDRLASDAAALERKKIALDLHDTAIQSYIGLQLGLAALRRKAAPSNPLTGELDKLAAMAADVIVELRDLAQGAGGRSAAGEPLCLAALRRQAAHAHAAYGVEVRIDIEGSIEFGDRLSAEVLQIVREGISNICRHTPAKRAAVALRCGDGLLRIDINNEHGGKPPLPFRPRSISERASALGGSAFVRQGRFNDTIVCVEIPL